MSSCLAPQFKWPPSTRATVLREPGCGGCAGGASFRPGRVHCALSSAAVFEAERLESIAAGARRLVYDGHVGSPSPTDNISFPGDFGQAILNQEAVVTAAAAEAVALARAAAEVAGEVARMVQTEHRPADVDNSHIVPDGNYLTREFLRADVRSRYTDTSLLDDAGFVSIFSDESESDDDEQGTGTQGVAVKSARQSERRARRVRAATKLAKSFSDRRPVTASLRKKRVKGCRNPLSCFYKMSGRRLLTAKQEVELSEGIQDLLKLEAVQKEVAHYNGGEPSFGQWAAAAGTDEHTLRKRLSHGIYCKNMMVKSNVRLVISIAKEFEGPGTDLSDLIQDGMQGLIRGAEKFDASKGFRFSTYSHWWIKQAIRKSVLEQTQIICLPAHMTEASSRVKECRRRLRRELNRLPTNEEIASDTGMTTRRVEAAMSLPRYSVSLTGKVGSTDVTYQEIMADTSTETAEETLHRWLMKRDVDKALDSLSPRERAVMRYRFGMDDGRARTLHDIGQLIGVSRERTRQIEMAAFRKLRSKKKVTSLQHYLEPAESW